MRERDDTRREEGREELRTGGGGRSTGAGGEWSVERRCYAGQRRGAGAGGRTTAGEVGECTPREHGAIGSEGTVERGR